MIDQEIKPFILSGYELKLEREKQFETKKTVIDIKLNFEEKAVEGKVELDIRINSRAIETIELDATDMQIYNVSVSGVPIKFDTYQEKLFVHGDFRAFGNYILNITYRAKPRRGGYFVNTDEGTQFWTQGEDTDSHAWFPCFDYPNMRSAYEIRVTVPKDYTVISNGQLLQIVEGDFKTFIYSEKFRFPAYLVSVIAGKFSSLKQEWQGIPIESYYRDKFSKYAELAFKNTPDMMEFLSTRIGVKYPYEKYSQTCVADFVYGGMENLSATTLTERTLHDETAHLDYQSESLVCHELTHQWFGDYVTCKDWSQAWLNEGFATYLALLYMERYKGKDEFLVDVQKHKEVYLKEYFNDYGRPVVEYYYKDPAELFDRHLYQKAALILRYFNFYLGDDIFWKGVKNYIETNKENGVETEDLRKALYSVSGFPLEQLFHQFIFEKGHPQLSVKEISSKRKILIRIQQKGFVYDLRIPLRIYYDDRVEDSEILLNSESKEIELDRAGFKALSIDPESFVLKTVDIDRPKEEARYILIHGRSVLERADAAVELSKFGLTEIDFLESAFEEEKFWYVKGKIAESVSRIGSERAEKAILNFLNTEDYKARKEVIKASGNFHSEDIYGKLKDLFEREKGYQIRAEIITSAQKNVNEKALDLIKKGLEIESYDDVIRISALNAMGELRDPSLIKEIKKFYSKSYGWQTRAAAVSAIGKLYWKDRDIGKWLIDAMNDNYFAVRQSVADSIKEIGDTDLISKLSSFLPQETDGRVKRAIREAIELRNKPQLETLNKLRDDIEKMRDKINSLEAKMNKKRL
ncbi:MAG: M1 family aminopeptidase [Thermoplasmata archaeon]